MARKKQYRSEPLAAPRADASAPEPAALESQPGEMASVEQATAELEFDAPEADAVAPAQSMPCDGLRVVAHKPSFWRCGRQFSPSPTIIPLGELSPDDIVRLTSDQNLTAEFVHL